MGFIQAIFAVGTTVVKLIRTVDARAKNYIREVVIDVLQQTKTANQPAPSPTPVSVNIEIDIKKIDLAETELEQKHGRDGQLKQSELDRLEEIRKQREDKFHEWQKAKVQEVMVLEFRLN